MIPRTQKSRGFTLIELLVVIAIIGLLSSVVLASLNEARQKARDARRIADLKQMQVALELYYTSQTIPGYPSATAALVTAYIQRVPVDPGTGAAYTYAVNTDGSYYCIGATMETLPLPISSCNDNSLVPALPGGNYLVGS